MLPTGERVKSQDFRRLEPRRIDFLAPQAAGSVLLRAVVPDSRENLLAQKSADGVDAGPVLRPLDKPLLGAVGEDVSQSLDLCGLFGADDDRLVASPEDLLPPAGKPPHFPRQLGKKMAHEP